MGLCSKCCCVSLKASSDWCHWNYANSSLHHFTIYRFYFQTAFLFLTGICKVWLSRNIPYLTQCSEIQCLGQWIVGKRRRNGLGKTLELIHTVDFKTVVFLMRAVSRKSSLKGKIQEEKCKVFTFFFSVARSTLWVSKQLNILPNHKPFLTCFRFSSPVLWVYAFRLSYDVMSLHGPHHPHLVNMPSSLIICHIIPASRSHPDHVHCCCCLLLSFSPPFSLLSTRFNPATLLLSKHISQLNFYHCLFFHSPSLTSITFSISISSYH